MQKDLLLRVQEALQARIGMLREVSRGSGVTYDTTMRIKNGTTDPVYSNVRALAEFLHLVPATEKVVAKGKARKKSSR